MYYLTVLDVTNPKSKVLAGLYLPRGPKAMEWLEACLSSRLALTAEVLLEQCHLHRAAHETRIPRPFGKKGWSSQLASVLP